MESTIDKLENSIMFINAALVGLRGKCKLGRFL
jgi:hypothetical protein